MEKASIIQLTKALYKVTRLFPKKEPLAYSMKKRGNLILSFLIILSNKELLLKDEEIKTFKIKCERNIKLLLSYFKIAEAENWIDSKNFEILENQYTLILKQLKTIRPSKRKPPKKPKKTKQKENLGFSLSETQEKVLSILQGNGKMKPSDINQYFKDLSPRSVRRELLDLKNRGIIVSFGSGKKTFYEMNSYY